MGNPETVWLYSGSAVTILLITVLLIMVLRRVLRKQTLPQDEGNSRRVVIDHVHTGAAWIDAEGLIRSANPAIAATLRVTQDELRARDWYALFARSEKDRVKEAYGQMMLMGIASLEANSERTDGSFVMQNVILMAAYDQKSQFLGHHCLMMDRTREKALEGRVQELSDALEHLTEALERVQAAAQLR